MKTNSIIKIKSLIALVAALLAVDWSATRALAASYTWNGGSGDWSTAGNWTPGSGPPGAGDTATINGGTATVSGDTSIDVLDLNGGTLNGSAILTVDTTMNWGGATMSGAGRTVVAVGATLNVSPSGGLSLSQRTLENGGTVIVTGTGNFNAGSGSVVTNRAGALWEVRNNADFAFIGGSLPRFDNAGIFRKAVGTGTTTFGGSFPFTNYGTVDLQTGTLHCNAAFNHFGTATIASGTVLRLAAGGTAGGGLDNASGGLVEWTSSYSLDVGAQLNGAGLYKISGGSLTVSTNVEVLNFDLGSGTLTGAATLTVGTTMNWGGATMSGAGRTVVAVGATLNVSPSSGLSLSQRTLENAGTVIVTGTGNFNAGSGSVVTNRAGALWEVRNNANFDFIGGSFPRFDNAGIFRKAVGTGTTTFGGGFPFTNYGTVDLQTGFLAYNAGFSPTSNSIVSVPIGGTTPGVNFGQLQVGSSVTLTGALSVAFVNGYYPAPSITYTVLTSTARSGVFANFYYPSNDVGMAVSNTSTLVYVKVINVRPTVPVIANQTNDEQVLFSLAVGATDDDSPAQILSYSLTNSPVGASVNGSGQIEWTPAESQGPMTTNITVRVTDNGTPNLTVSRTLQIVVNEVNVAPVFSVIATQHVLVLATMTVSNAATDADIPANTLSYALESPPSGVMIDANGTITWTPSTAQTNIIKTIVTDDGTPPLTATNYFTVEVTNTCGGMVVHPATLRNGVLTNAYSKTISASGGAGPYTFAVTGGSLPAGLTLTGAGVLSGTPTALGTNMFDVTATDMNGCTNSRSYTVKIAPTNWFGSVVGKFNGLFSDTSGVADQSAGFFTLNLTSTRKFSLKCYVGGDILLGAGSFTLAGDGTMLKPISRKGKGALQATWELNPLDESEQITGSIYATNGDWTAEALGDRVVWDAGTNPATALMGPDGKGRYTIVIPGSTNTATEPAGDAYQLAALKSTGKISATGAGSDFLKPPMKPIPTVISKSGVWPFFAPIYKYYRANTNPVTVKETEGEVIGWLTLSNNTVSGDLIWIKTFWTNAPYYTNGFTNMATVVASSYVKPGIGTNVMTATNGTLVIADGNVPTPLTNAWYLYPINKLVVSNNTQGIKLPISSGKGELAAWSFTNPATPTVVTKGKAALLQSQNEIRGVFLGTNQSGSLRMAP